MDKVIHFSIADVVATADSVTVLPFPGNYPPAPRPRLIHPPVGPAPSTDPPGATIRFHAARRHGYNAMDVLNLVKRGVNDVDITVVDAAIKSIHGTLHKMATIRKPPGFAHN